MVLLLRVFKAILDRYISIHSPIRPLHYALSAARSCAVTPGQRSFQRYPSPYESHTCGAAGQKKPVNLAAKMLSAHSDVRHKPWLV